MCTSGYSHTDTHEHIWCIIKLRAHTHDLLWSVADDFFIFLCPDCDFEDSHLCGYSNQWNANVNWYVGGGVQLLHNNIPYDHTYNNKTGECYADKGFFLIIL